MVSIYAETLSILHRKNTFFTEGQGQPEDNTRRIVFHVKHDTNHLLPKFPHSSRDSLVFFTGRPPSTKHKERGRGTPGKNPKISQLTERGYRINQFQI
jgi:hypothetical protein